MGEIVRTKVGILSYFKCSEIEFHVRFCPGILMGVGFDLSDLKCGNAKNKRVCNHFQEFRGFWGF